MPVAVAGAGIAGLTAAIALSQRGFSVDLFERAPQLTEIGAGIQLPPNAMAVLERLGIAGRLAGTATEPPGIEIRDARSGASLASMRLGSAARRRYGAPYCVVHRAELQASLLEAARAAPDIALHLGSSVDDVHAAADHISFRVDGTERRADVLVAADGVHSRIRIEGLGYSGARSLGCTAWRALVPTPAVADLPDVHAIGLWLGSGAHLVHYSIQGGTNLNVVLIADGESGDAEPPTSAFGRHARRLIDAVPAWTLWPLSAVDARRSWVKGRAVLIGDAAHAMAPSAAQGGAQAIEDAWVLADELARSEADPAAALQRFERRRRPRVERVANAALRNLEVFHLKGGREAGRNLILQALPAILLARQFDWLFRWSPE